MIDLAPLFLKRLSQICRGGLFFSSHITMYSPYINNGIDVGALSWPRYDMDISRLEKLVDYFVSTTRAVFYINVGSEVAMS